MNQVVKAGIALGCMGGLALAGCASADDADVSGGGSAITASSAPTAPVDLTPAYWNVDALADSPSPGSEPINVIVTTNIPMDAIVAALPATRNPEQGLAVWRPVSLGVGLTACISEERATIDGAPTTVGNDAQAVSLRLGGVEGCEGVLFDGESHARGWMSKTRSATKDAAGRTVATWYFALSQEHVCLVDEGGAVPKPWHCILPQGFVGTLPGISGSIFTAPTGGYNQGRDQFVANLKKLPFKVACTSIARTNASTPNGGGVGEGLFVPVADLQALASPDAVEEDPRNPGKQILKRVTWDDQATHCTITQ